MLSLHCIYIRPINIGDKKDHNGFDIEVKKAPPATHKSYSRHDCFGCIGCLALHLQYGSTVYIGIAPV